MKLLKCALFLLAGATITGSCLAQGGEPSTSMAGGGRGGVNAINDQTKTLGMPGQDEDFLRSALDYANAEHALAMDAKTRASSEDVKAEAGTLEEQSVDTMKRLAAYGPSLGVKMPKDLNGKYKKQMAKLADSGDKYDKDWVKDMVNLHHDSIELYMNESTASHEPAYQQLAGKILPTEQKDATSLKALQAKVGK